MEEKLINIAIKQLEKNTGIPVSFTHLTNISAQSEFDGALELEIGQHNHSYQTVVKQEIRNHQLNKLQILNDSGEPIIIIAKRLFPKIKDALREMNIAYIEENGNCYINNENLFIFIHGNTTIEEKEKVNRAFTKTGLKVIFQYLLSPEKINAPYREIAENADVAIGNITYIKNGLNELGYLIPINKKEEKLINLPKLLDVWVNEYGKILKPTLHIGNFRFIHDVSRNYWKSLDMEDERTVWGGEPAAYSYDKYLEPEILTVYTDVHSRDLMKKYRIAPSPTGNIEMYKKFWKNTENIILAPPILTYADLITSGNSRCLEAADILYKKHIDGHLQKFS